MNLISNGLKFTKNGGKIQIICKMVYEMNDFTHPEIVNCEKLLKNKENGLLEVIVKDNGVGIKVED